MNSLYMFCKLFTEAPSLEIMNKNYSKKEAEEKENIKAGNNKCRQEYVKACEKWERK